MANKIEEFIGFQFEPYSYAVEKGKIREFALAIGDNNPIYFDEEAARREGFAGIPIPLTFLQVIDMWGGGSFVEFCEELGLNLSKVLHGEQKYQYFKPVLAGDVLSVYGRVADIQVKQGSSGGMNIVDLQFDYKNQRDELVAQSRNVIIERH